MKSINKSIDKERLFLRSSSNTILSRHTISKHIKLIDLGVKKIIKRHTIPKHIKLIDLGVKKIIKILNIPEHDPTLQEKTS